MNGNKKAFSVFLIICFLSGNVFAELPAKPGTVKDAGTQCLAPLLISSFLNQKAGEINSLLDAVYRADSMGKKPEWDAAGKAASEIKRKWVASYLRPWFAEIFSDGVVSAGEVAKVREAFRLEFRKATARVNRERTNPVPPEMIEEVLADADDIFDIIEADAGFGWKEQLARVEIWGSESAEHLTLSPEGTGELVVEADSLPITEEDLAIIYEAIGEVEGLLAGYSLPEVHPKTGKPMRPVYDRYEDLKQPVYKVILRIYGMDGWNYEFENTKQTEYQPLIGKNEKPQPTRVEMIDFMRKRFEEKGRHDFSVSLNRSTIITVVKKGATKVRGVEKLLEKGPLVYFGDEFSLGNDREIGEAAVDRGSLLCVALDKKKKIEGKNRPFPGGAAYIGDLTDGLKKVLRRFVDIMKEGEEVRTDTRTVAAALVRAIMETSDWEFLEKAGQKEEVEAKLQAFLNETGSSAGPIGLAFDSDGTLTAGRGAPIDTEMTALLAEVASLTQGSLSVITGKLRDDLRECYIPDDLCLIARESEAIARKRDRAVAEKFAGTKEERIIEGVSAAFMRTTGKGSEEIRTVYFPQRMEFSSAEKAYLEELKRVSNARFVPYSEGNMDRIKPDKNTSVIMFSSTLRGLEKASVSDASVMTLLESAKILPVDDEGADTLAQIMLKNGLEVLAIGVILADVEQRQIEEGDAQAQGLLDAMRAITQRDDLMLADMAGLIKTVSGDTPERIRVLLTKLLISVPMGHASIQSLNALRAIYWAA